MDRIIFGIIVYIAGVVFDLAVIAYLNERKGNMYYHGLATASWALLLVFLLIGIDAVMKSICDFFCLLFRERT
jgi:Na+/H+ antiporter NhaC